MTKNRASSPLIPLLSVLALLPARSVEAAPASLTRSRAIAWLEANQNPDGSWGTGAVKPVVTAEGLLALARAERIAGTAAQRAKAWLLNQEWTSVDFEARSIRALEEANVDMSVRAAVLNALGSSSGWGPTSARGVDSYDSALALAAIQSAGLAPPDLHLKLAGVQARQRSDGGWSGDGIPASVSGSDRTVSAEIVRALSTLYGDWQTPASPRLLAQRFLSTDQANGGALVNSGSDTLELAARMAALHAVGVADGQLEAELLDDDRLAPNGVWSETDAYVNAIGLLALTTKPNATFSTTCQNSADFDCDSFVDSIDVFPHDPTEHSDLDSDGIGDVADRDRDGDGFCDYGEPPDTSCTGIDRFPDDVTENIDNDSDGIGDNDETDSDGDSIPNLAELEQGTDPADRDSDNDGSHDQFDPCPLIAYGSDADNDHVCAPLDECDNVLDPLARSAVDIRNLDGDNRCDEADLDDDGDGFSDAIEVVWGSDPRDESSVPDNIAVTDPSGDFDQDGRTNLEETSPPFVLTNPYLADTDGDGALDGQELLGSPAHDPNSASSQPAAVLAVAAGGTAEPVSGQFVAELASPGMRATTTLGQPTPVATADPPHVPSAGPSAVSLAGFQPQTYLARDMDGDGLDGNDENQKRTSAMRVDTDGDRFVDGESEVVSKSRYGDGRDLDGDGFVEGEGTIGTDPTEGESRPGRPGDVAPLGFPDGQLRLADTLVETRLVSNPSLIDTLSGDSRDITLDAADWDGDGFVQSDDLLKTLNAVEAEDVLP